MAARLFHSARADGDSGRVALSVLQVEEVAINPALSGTCHQLQDDHGVRPNCAADLAHSRRRGHRVKTTLNVCFWH